MSAECRYCGEHLMELTPWDMVRAMAGHDCTATDFWYAVAHAVELKESPWIVMSQWRRHA